jgi:hypothetical protein
MRKITAFITSLMLSSIIWGEAMTPVSAQASCQDTVDVVVRDVRKRGGSVKIGMAEFDFYNALDNSKRVNGIVFAFRTYPGKVGHIGENILHSEVLLKSYVTKVFRACGGTGYIRFGPDGSSSDWSFGMTDSGILTIEDCANSPEELINTISSIEGPGMNGYCAYAIPDF